MDGEFGNLPASVAAREGEKQGNFIFTTTLLDEVEDALSIYFGLIGVKSMFW